MFELLLASKLPLIVLQIITSPILIGLVLLQSGKDGDLGTALGGGGGGGSVLGTGGTSKVLVRATIVFTVIFMVNSIALAKIFKEESATSIGGSAAEPLVPAGVDLDGLNLDIPTEKEAAPGAPAAEPKTPKE